MISRQYFINRLWNIANRKDAKDSSYFSTEVGKLYDEMNPTDADHMTPEERRCFGSALNKFGDQANVRNLTMTNIDLIVFNENSKKIRIIEYKHGNEKINPGHLRLLHTFAKIAAESKKFEIEVCIVYADYPFNHGHIKFFKFDENENIVKDSFREFKTQGEMRQFLNMTDTRY